MVGGHLDLRGRAVAPGEGSEGHGEGAAGALLVTVGGRDRPGLTAVVCGALAGLGARLDDVEQVTIGGQLTLQLMIVAPGPPEEVRAALTGLGTQLGVDIGVAPVPGDAHDAVGARAHVTVLGHPLPPAALGGIAAAIAAHGANIERIERLARYPIMALELIVACGDVDELRSALAAEAARVRVDVAVQPAGLHRRAKRLVCMDVDSTLVDGEVIEMVAAHAGHAGEVAAITDAAMAGEVDFEAALRRRVALLDGTPVEALDEVRASLRLMPGARTLVRTLHRLGYVVAMVSGGFSAITEPLREELGIAYGAANELEVVGGRLTGRLVGPIVDRAAKAEWLRRFADLAGVPLAQTVAVGDGANDVDMLAIAGLGIAFNAKPVVQEAADTALSMPYLDAILFLLGISREEVEAADADDPGFDVVPPPPVPQAPATPR